MKNATNTTGTEHYAATHQNLEPGTKVINTEDGEFGLVIRVATLKRNARAAYTYEVQTADGTEIWNASQTLTI